MTAALVIENIQLSENTFRLRTERTPHPIRAGQCFSIGTADLGINREYSMYSSAHDAYVDFLIRKIDDGVVSSRLASCKPGDSVEISGPFGEFCLSESDVLARNFVFIASGTGIAPFHSFVKTFPTLRYLLLHGIRHDDEQYDATDYKIGSYIPAVSRSKRKETRGRVTDFLHTIDLPDNSLFYLCGNQKMIVDAIDVLRIRGIAGGSIFTETFF